MFKFFMDVYMKAKGIVVASSGLIALIGTMLPLATAGTFTFAIHNGGGALPLLYIFPIILIGIGSAAIAGKFQKIPHFVIPLSVASIALVSLGIYAGMENLKIISSGPIGNVMGMLGGMSQAMGMGKVEAAPPAIGIGGWAIGVSYVAAIIGSLLKSKTSTSSL